MHTIVVFRASRLMKEMFVCWSLLPVVALGCFILADMLLLSMFLTFGYCSRLLACFTCCACFAELCRAWLASLTLQSFACLLCLLCRAFQRFTCVEKFCSASLALRALLCVLACLFARVLVFLVGLLASQAHHELWACPFCL